MLAVEVPLVEAVVVESLVDVLVDVLVEPPVSDCARLSRAEARSLPYPWPGGGGGGGCIEAVVEASVVDVESVDELADDELADDEASLVVPLLPALACGGGGGAPPSCPAAEKRSPRNCCSALVIELAVEVEPEVEPELALLVESLVLALLSVDDAFVLFDVVTPICASAAAIAAASGLVRVLSLEDESSALACAS